MTLQRHLLVIDNEDSFVYNLADAFCALGHRVDVFRSDWPADEALRFIHDERPQLLILSPGPCGPRDAALAMELLRAAPATLPVFGVCLGHQCIVEHFGGRVEATGAPVHGKATMIRHDGSPVWDGIESPFAAARYHSLAATAVPDELIVCARAGELVMAVHHRTRPVFGVQFHPESVLTPVGQRLLVNVVTELTKGAPQP